MTTTADPQHVAEHERTTWNRCAPIYIETLEPLTKQGFQVISDSGHIRDGVRLLDVGCGPASFTAAFARMGADVSGVDFSEDMVEIAKNEQPHLDIRHADVENLPFEDESFDVVTASYALHHLARPTVAFRSIHRVLKPSGRFVFVIPNQEAQKSFGAFFMAVVAHHELEAMPGGPLLMETDMAVVSELIKDAGFLECQIEPLELSASSPRWSLSSGPVASSQTSALCRRSSATGSRPRPTTTPRPTSSLMARTSFQTLSSTAPP
jgi:ubiquinone/menaquinone biosynthesis C-methylase UbiE